ncbi:MAG: hypothetical protein K8S54_05740 [Spirochaetia bacterium]|nr:hypothetical protein [Spirochaetia bacterium]
MIQRTHIYVSKVLGLVLLSAGIASCSGFPSNTGTALASALLFNSVSSAATTAAGAAASGSAGSTGPFVINSNWNCGATTDCQDVNDFVITNPVASDVLTVTVSAVTGTSTIRMSVFAPGSGLNGVNLINGGTTDHRCFGTNVGDSVTVNNQTTTGTYRVGLGRDWNNSSGNTGTYTLTVSYSAAKLAYTGQTLDDTATLLVAATTCP